MSVLEFHEAALLSESRECEGLRAHPTFICGENPDPFGVVTEATASAGGALGCRGGRLRAHELRLTRIRAVHPHGFRGAAV